MRNSPLSISFPISSATSCARFRRTMGAFGNIESTVVSLRLSGAPAVFDTYPVRNGDANAGMSACSVTGSHLLSYCYRDVSRMFSLPPTGSLVTLRDRPGGTGHRPDMRRQALCLQGGRQGCAQACIGGRACQRVSLRICGVPAHALFGPDLRRRILLRRSFPSARAQRSGGAVCNPRRGLDPALADTRPHRQIGAPSARL